MTQGESIQAAEKHFRGNNFTEADRLCRQILAREPRNAEALHLHGLILQRDGKNEQAVELFNQAISINPDAVGYHSNLGVALRSLGRFDEAAAAYRRALEIKPHLVHVRRNLSSVLKEMGRAKEALDALGELTPDDAEAVNDIGIVIYKQGDLDGSLLAFQKALQLRPSLSPVWNNLGNVLRHQGNLEQAVEAYRRAIAIRVDYPDAHQGLGMALLQMGHFYDGWFEYEWRWKVGTAKLREFRQPRWCGEDPAGKTVFVYEEQGYGDAIQFFRYASLLAERGARVIVGCNPALSRLLGEMPGVSQVVTAGQMLPAFDLHCPAMSMPLFFDTRLETVPAPVPYFHVAAERIDKWKDRLNSRARPGDMPPGDSVILRYSEGSGRDGELASPVGSALELEKLSFPPPLAASPISSRGSWEARGMIGEAASGGVTNKFSSSLADAVDASSNDPRASRDNAVVRVRQGGPYREELHVGLAWAGNPELATDPIRSISLKQLAPLADVAGVTFHSLSITPVNTAECDDLRIQDHSALLTDFAETAALIANLDLVISVDTAVAHLTGALGKPVWLLLPCAPDWRWMMKREDSPWYPTMRLFRQPTGGDWPSVIRNVVQALGSFSPEKQGIGSSVTKAVKAPTPSPGTPGEGRDRLMNNRVSDHLCSVAPSVILRYSEGSGLSGEQTRSFGVPQDDGKAQQKRVTGASPKSAEMQSEMAGNARPTSEAWPTTSTQPTIDQAFQVAQQQHQAGLLPQAEALYRQILTRQPNHASALHYLGVISHQHGRHDAAVDLIRRAVSLRPDYPEALVNLGNALQASGKLDEALSAYRQAIALRPHFPQAHDHLRNALSNIGNSLREREQLDEAIVACRQAISLDPGFANAHNNLGIALWKNGQAGEAIASYRRAIALKPDYSQAHINLAYALMAVGELCEGWIEYEWRWRCKEFPTRPRHFVQPLWDGQPLAGTTLLIHAEQGFGDTIQFIRYLPFAVRQGGKVIVECQPEVKGLIEPWAGGLPVITRGEPLPSFDVHCPMLSLPRAFGTTLETVPRQVPYLHADLAATERWRQRLAAEPSSFKIGLAWSGSKAHANDHSRSMPLSAFAPLARLPGVRLHSLQKTGRENSNTLPDGLQLADWSNELGDFADTAALMANLDLVISVDTAVAHLAGAMGKPVWILLPFAADWRWMMNREDSPWYPTARLLRQKSPGDWAEVIERVLSSKMRESMAGGML